jgi:rhodanese-related sulfurtransferase
MVLIAPRGLGQPAWSDAAPGGADYARRVAIGVDELLREARSQLDRVTPEQAREEAAAGALLIDIRTDAQRERDGVLPGVAHVPRNVLEWRLDPESPHRDPELARRDRRIILVCDAGYQSSLAAATVRRFGLDATDVIGGASAWLADQNTNGR